MWSVPPKRPSNKRVNDFDSTENEVTRYRRTISSLHFSPAVVARVCGCRHIQGARWKMRAGVLDRTSSPFFERNAVDAGRSATAAESWWELQADRVTDVSNR